MAVKRYLFWINNEKVKLYKLKEESFEVILNKGDSKKGFPCKDISEFLDSDNYIDISQITDDDFIDYCFISDTAINLDIDKFNPVDETLWTEDMVKRFADNYISKCENSYIIKSTNLSCECENSGKKVFYKKLIPEITFSQEDDLVVDNHIAEAVINEDDDSEPIFSKYWREKYNKIKNR